MASQSVINFSFSNVKKIEKNEVIQYQQQIDGVLKFLQRLHATFEFEMKGAIKDEADTTIHKEISVVFSFKESIKVHDEIFFIIYYLQNRLHTLPMIIRLVSDNFDQVEFCCRNNNIEVNDFRLGIIQNGNFIIHQTVDPADQVDILCQEECKEYWPTSWNCFFAKHPKGRSCVFRLDAIHEKKQLVLRMPLKDRELEFGNRPLKSDLPGMRHVHNEINIKMLYENVVKMTMDVMAYKPEYLHHFQVVLYIHYRHCPSVFISPWYRETDTYGKGYRYIKWSDKFTVKDFLPNLFNSTVMAVEIRIPRDELNQLFCQLRDLVQCKMEFRTFKHQIGRDYFPFRISKSWPFEIRYLVSAILSIGYSGKSRLLASSKVVDQFIQFVDDHLEQEKEQELSRKLTRLFFEIIQDEDYIDNGFQFQKLERLTSMDKSFEKIRKVIITPTRILLFPPEPVMGSRIVRKVGADRILRVVFRDDTMDMMRSQTCPPYVIKETVQYYLQNQLRIAREKFYFLGYSNSQLRDHGCYFLRADRKDEIIDLLKEMGDFKNEGVAKTMARFAQCFTQSRVSELEINPGNCAEIADIESSAKDGNGKPYCFSDGVGLISKNHAKKLIRKLKIENNPSCFQFRCGGWKGVLSVDPLLDRQQQWLEENGFHKTGNKTMKCDVLFRPSQNKFTSKLDNNLLEIVKQSSPVPMRLNKPLINIYDQVSEKQGKDVADVIKKRIMELVSDHISGILQSLTEETAFREALMDVPVYAPINQMPSYSTLVDEPFFRSLVIARAKLFLKLLNLKKRIKIPHDLGRCMFGIVDPYGILQYGQVFVQYSKNIVQNSKYPPKVVLKGRVAISKNPMCSAGDLRMFDAIDVPALRHYVDVVVFPQYGPRPHPDEMAGSDLDGDEYSLIWDQELLLKYNEPAFDYTPPKPEVEKVEIENLIEEAGNFFVNYLTMDMVGQVANAHLANSDLYGLDSSICETIAKKQMLAVDFAKTCVPMERLTNKWNGEYPPEIAERHPDFMQKDYAPCYESPRLLGEIHRKITRFYDVMNSIMTQSEEEALKKIELDVSIDVDGWEEHIKSVEEIHESYCRELDQLMVAYGVLNEGELFSQHFTVLKQRLNSKETDNMAGFTTVTLIQAQVFNIFTRYRQGFFEYFGVKFTSDEQKDIIREKTTATAEMKKRAVAYYKIAYTSNYYLSFAWLVWDVIDQVRLEKRLPIKMDAIGERISAEIERREFTKFEEVKNGLRKTCAGIIPYLERYDGLGKLLHFLIKWRDQQHYLDTINKPKICLLFVQFGLGVLPRPKGYFPFLEQTTEDNQDDKHDLRNGIGGLGRKLIYFFSTLGSDEFFRMNGHDYSKPNLGPNKAVYEQEQWIKLHEAGLAAHLNIAAKIYSNVLLTFNSDGKYSKNSTQIVKPNAPFVIEIPMYMEDVFLEALPGLKELSGCIHIAYQIQETFYSKDPERPNSNMKISIWPKGTPSQIQSLRKMLTIGLTLIQNETPKQTSERMGKLMIDKLLEIIGPLMTADDIFVMNYIRSSNSFC